MGRFASKRPLNVLSFDWFTAGAQTFIPGWQPRAGVSSRRLPFSSTFAPPPPSPAPPPPPPQKPLRSGWPSTIGVGSEAGSTCAGLCCCAPIVVTAETIAIATAAARKYRYRLLIVVSSWSA